MLIQIFKTKVKELSIELSFAQMMLLVIHHSDDQMIIVESRHQRPIGRRLPDGRNHEIQVGVPKIAISMGPPFLDSYQTVGFGLDVL